LAKAGVEQGSTWIVLVLRGCQQMTSYITTFLFSNHGNQTWQIKVSRDQLLIQTSLSHLYTTNSSALNLVHFLKTCCSGLAEKGKRIINPECLLLLCVGLNNSLYKSFKFLPFHYFFDLRIIVFHLVREYT
jgi:hypothetical protein